MNTQTDRNEASRERRENGNIHARSTLYTGATLVLLLILNFAFAIVQYIRLEAQVEINTEWRKSQVALVVTQQEQYIKGLMAIQGLSASMEALIKQVTVLSEQQEAFRRELSTQRPK